MSGAAHLARAIEATRAAEADAHAAQAILADPDLAPAYALRGRIAALSGDCVTAAHYYRVAYSRGDQSAETRAALGACVAAAGDPQGGAQIQRGAALPAMLESFGELVSMQGAMLRGVLRASLPPAGQPAFLPGTAPPNARSAPQSAPPSRGASRTVSLGSLDPIEPAARPQRSAPPAPRPAYRSAPPPRPAPRSVPPARPRTVSLGSPEPSVSRRAPVAPAEDDWLEASHTERTATASASTASWLDDPYFSDVTGGSVQAEVIELATDPGDLAVQARSPVTGQLIERHELLSNTRDAAMPSFETEQAAATPTQAEADLFEARAALAAAGVGGLRLALHLPGPVITAQGRRPQKLGAQMALGLTPTELALRDPQTQRPPIRVPFSQLRRMDVVRAGQQLSFALTDGRQLHFDLRDLVERAPSLGRILIAELDASLRAVGATVNA